MEEYIKTLVDAVCAIFDNTVLPDGTDLRERKLGKLVRIELGEFMIYLALSDGAVTQDEAEAIGAMMKSADFGLGADIDRIALYAKAGNILSTEFESKPQLGFKTVVNIDNAIARSGRSEKSKFSDSLLTVYKILGKWIIDIDGEASIGERINYDTYIKMLEDYRDANYIGDEDEDMDDEDEDMDDEDEDMDDEDEDMDDDDADTDDADDVAELNVDMAEDYIREILARKPARRGVEAPRKG